MRDRVLASVLARSRKGVGLQPALKPAPPILPRVVERIWLNNAG
jgi:hypothetical protein